MYKSFVSKLTSWVEEVAGLKQELENVPDHALSDDGEQVRSYLAGEGGRFEVGDPTPTAPPIGYTPPNDLRFLIERVMNQMRERAEQEGFESPDEADDFDVGDDFDPTLALTDSEIMAMDADELRRYIKSQMPPSKEGGAGASPAADPNARPSNSPTGPTEPVGQSPATATPPAAPPAQSNPT